MATPATSILDLDPEAFTAALDELGLPPEERAFVEQQYFAQSRALPMTERPEGKRVGMVAPIAFPEEMTGAEALMSGEWDWAIPEFIRGMYEAPAEAANVAGAAAQGIPVTEQQMQEAAQGAAEVFTGIGPARALVRGQMPGRNVVSMSGIGDNGGPPLDDMPSGPRRYINPNTGLYSPSFEAAKNLPQEVGTAQQMRSMLLKGGAKEEELVYSGFDDWLKGKDRVTKQEIEDVLFDSAAGFGTGNMPYVRVSEKARAGITGVQNTSFGDLQDRYIQDLRRQAIDERNARMESELRGRGYGPIQFANEGEYRQMADQVRALYDDPRISLRHRPPARIMNAITQIDSMMQRQGRSFEDREVQRILNRLADDYDYVLGPSGLPEFTDDVVVRELPDFASNPYFGSLPTQTVDEIQERVYNMSEQDLADQLGISVDDMLANFEPGRSQYGNYVVPGMRNYSENQYVYDDSGRGVLSGITAAGVRPYNQRHFGSEKKPLMFFTLTGELNTPEGPAYNLATIQSDIGQDYRRDPDKFFVPGSTSLVPEITKQERKVLQDYVALGKEFSGASSRYNEIYNELVENYMDDEGLLIRGKPGATEVTDRLREARSQLDTLAGRLMGFETDNWDLLYKKVVNPYQTPVLMSDLVDRSRPVWEYDAGQFEAVLSGTATPKITGSSRTASLPFATSTNRWLDAALKNELINAAKSGAEWITIPKGADVQKYTYGEVEGQEGFYGGPDKRGIAPTRLKNLAKEFIPFETEFKDMEATGFGPNAPTYNVFGMRLTPEIRKFLLEQGLPSFAKGGPVTGSSLDVDVFAFQ